MARVLVIEDDAAINDVVTTRLTRDGHAVTQAFSALRARLAAGRCRREGRGLRRRHLRPHASGATGEELVGLIRGRDEATPVIVISARTCRRGQDRPSAPRRRRLPHQALRPRRAGRARGGAAAAPRDETQRGEVLRWQRWTLDPEARTLAVAPGEAGERGGSVSLTKIEFNILEALVVVPTACSQSRSSSSWHGASPSPATTPPLRCTSPTSAPSSVRPARTTTCRPSGAWASSSHDPIGDRPLLNHRLNDSRGVCPQLDHPQHSLDLTHGF